MNIILLGAAGFIGTNLILRLVENPADQITAVDVKKEYFQALQEFGFANVRICECEFNRGTDFVSLLQGQDVVYHLISTTVPTNSNQYIVKELEDNVLVSARILEACIAANVKKVVFLSSGGTVYGRESACPLKEDTPTYPISSYGVQKITIEKLLYLYYCMYGLDYRVIRLANPYGPYQRPNGVLGAVTTFTYKALMGEPITVYGNGSVVRDYIFIEDAIRAIQCIVGGEAPYRTFNVGCGYGISIRDLLDSIQSTLEMDLNIEYMEGRNVDVPVNYLDISRYESCYGKLHPADLSTGIRRTAEFMKRYYRL